MPASLSGHDPALGRRARPRSEAARRHARRHRSASCSTRCTRTTPSTWRPRRTTPISRRGSPAMRWRSRCRRHAPEAVDLAQRDRGDAGTVRPGRRARPKDFGRRCLLARRLVERGVRFVQLYSGGDHNDNNWDAHGDLVKNHNLPRRPHRQADRRPAEGSEAARPARRDAGGLGRRVRPPADRRIRQGHRPRSQRLRLHHVDGRRRDQGRHQRRRDRRARRRGGRPIASTSSTCTPPSCSRWASTPSS